MAFDIDDSLPQSISTDVSNIGSKDGIVFDTHKVSDTRTELSRALGNVRLHYGVYHNDHKTVYVYGVISLHLERSREIKSDVDLGGLF